MCNQSLLKLLCRHNFYTLFSALRFFLPAGSFSFLIAVVHQRSVAWLFSPLHKNYPGGFCFSLFLPSVAYASILILCGMYFLLFQCSPYHFPTVRLFSPDNSR